MRIRRVLQGSAWILLYILLTLTPLVVMLAGPRPEGREFWREFSVALGFVGLAMMALQFALTARFKVLKSPYGADMVYYFHRQISLVAFTLIMAHPIILFVFSPDTLQLLNILTAPWRARAAVTATLALTLVIALSIWRKKLKINYTRWRIWHGILATAAVALALVHITLVGHYLDLPWKRVLWVGYGLFFLGMLLWTRVIKPLQLLARPYEVVGVTEERGDTRTLALRPVGHLGFRFHPGQFAWITARHSPFKDREHPFSISSSSEQRDAISFTIKNLGDFTATIKDMQPGEVVYVDGPYGSFSVDRHPHARNFVFIAGGVGITPMMSMLRSLADRGDQRPLVLIYGNKTWEAVTFREELDELQKRLNLKVVHVLENPPDDWQGERGFVTAKLLDALLPPQRERNQTEIFICGPALMMDAVEKALNQLGIPPGDFHSERFDLV